MLMELAENEVAPSSLTLNPSLCVEEAHPGQPSTSGGNGFQGEFKLTETKTEAAKSKTTTGTWNMSRGTWIEGKQAKSEYTTPIPCHTTFYTSNTNTDCLTLTTDDPGKKETTNKPQIGNKYPHTQITASS